MKKSKLFILIGSLLISISLLIIFYNILSSFISLRNQKKYSLLVKDVIKENADNISDYLYNPDISMPTTKIDGKKYVGLLYIEKFDMEFPVLSSWNKKNKLPSVYYGSAYLNNMVICSHNFTNQFGKINKLRNGDIVSFTDMDGNIFNYKVKEIELLSGNDVDGMINSGYDLTLFCCDLSNNNRTTIRLSKI